MVLTLNILDKEVAHHIICRILLLQPAIEVCLKTILLVNKSGYFNRFPHLSDLFYPCNR